MAAMLLGGFGNSHCRYAITWSGNRIHRRSGRYLWCDINRAHAGPPWPEVLRTWLRCERCFPVKK
jgi:hypothetical protein